MAESGDSQNIVSAGTAESCQFLNLPVNTQTEVLGGAAGDGIIAAGQAYKATQWPVVSLGYGAVTAARSFFDRSNQAADACLGNLQLTNAPSGTKGPPRQKR